jgi:hypothetical protein
VAALGCVKMVHRISDAPIHQGPTKAIGFAQPFKIRKTQSNTDLILYTKVFVFVSLGVHEFETRHALSSKGNGPGILARITDVQRIPRYKLQSSHPPLPLRRIMRSIVTDVLVGIPVPFEAAMLLATHGAAINLLFPRFDMDAETA